MTAPADMRPRRRVFHDWEFLEDGERVWPISVGMVDEAGAELYVVNGDAPWRKIKRHGWLMSNVVPYLPKAYGDARNHLPRGWLFNMADPRVVPRATMARKVEEFLLGPAGARREQQDLELWAYYGAYDHLCLAQLWGPMSDLPAGIPMFSHDFEQEYRRKGKPAGRPDHAGAQHRAIDDARTLASWVRWLDQQPAALS